MSFLSTVSLRMRKYYRHTHLRRFFIHGRKKRYLTNFVNSDNIHFRLITPPTLRKRKMTRGDEEGPKSYVLEQKLESGANLRILIFEPDEIKLMFKYKYEQIEKPRKKRTLINETMLEVGYLKGELVDCLLSMNIIVPPLLGKQYALGVDISPGAKTYAEFKYEYACGALYATAVQVGAQPKIELKELDDFKMIRSIVRAPFPLFYNIPLTENYTFKIPFLHNSNEVRFFEFKSNILKNMM